MPSSNKKKLRETEIILTMLIVCGRKPQLEELKALFGINILMGLNPLPQYKLYWHQNDFISNSGVKKQWHAEDIKS